MRVTRSPFRGLLLAAALGLGCSDNTGPNQPEVKNDTNSFELKVSSMTDYSSTLSYTWYNTGNTASVVQSSSVQAGAVILTVRDANGAVVYTSAMTQTGTFVTSSGAPGNWQILVVSANASGNLNLKLQRGT